MPSAGVGGVIGTEDFTFVSSRDIADRQDIFACLDTETGLRLWEFSYEAPGKLDYGNSPRSSAVVADPYVYTLGAFGHLNCLSIDTGKAVWSKHLVEDLDGIRPDWGYCGSLLYVDGKIIVQPGGPNASVVALDAETGEPVWKSPGRKSAYASLMPWQKGTQKLVVGFDQITFNGWEIETGKRWWEVVPDSKSDFNVPTPVLFDHRLTITTETNGTRLLEWNGEEEPRILATSDELSGDTHTPVRMGRFLVGVDGDLKVLDTDHDLRLVGVFEEPKLSSYSSLIVHENRILVHCEDGTLILVNWDGMGLRELGRLETQTDKGQLLAHPAMVGHRLLLRGIQQLQAWEWEGT